MVYLTVRVTSKSQIEVEKLEALLEIWNIKIIKKEVDDKQLILKLIINAAMPSRRNLVISIAQSRFQEDLLESSMHYDYDNLLE